MLNTSEIGFVDPVSRERFLAAVALDLQQRDIEEAAKAAYFDGPDASRAVFASIGTWGTVWPTRERIAAIVAEAKPVLDQYRAVADTEGRKRAFRRLVAHEIGRRMAPLVGVVWPQTNCVDGAGLPKAVKDQTKE